MKRLLTAVAVLTFFTAVPMFALDTPDTTPRDTRGEGRDRTSVIDDVIRMTQAGVSDEAIIKFVQESRDQYVVDADVIIALTDAHVSKPVLEVVMDEAYRRGDKRARRDDRRGNTTVHVRPYYAYDPWYSPFYDPYWYGPRLSIGFGWGGGFRGNRGGHIGGGHRGGRRH
jgi:hypothetical protein